MSESFSSEQIGTKKITTQTQKSLQDEIVQIASEESFEDACSQVFNPWAADQDKQEKFKALTDRKAELLKVVKHTKVVVSLEQLEASAERFQQRNPELNARALLRLLRSLTNRDSKETVTKKVREIFPDPTIAVEAFEFLLENTENELHEILVSAKEEFEATFKKEIAAGQNIAKDVVEYAQKGLGTAASLRDLYRDITGNPREPYVLFDQLTKVYSFTRIKDTISFLLHALGSDLKSKGPSIERGELARLFTEARSLQAILGVYRFFRSRVRQMEQAYREMRQSLPKELDFESMSKTFIKIITESHPSVQKIQNLLKMLKAGQSVKEQIVVTTQFRDGIRACSPRLFKSQEQRDATLSLLLQILEELENKEADNGDPGANS